MPEEPRVLHIRTLVDQVEIDVVVEQLPLSAVPVQSCKSDYEPADGEGHS